MFEIPADSMELCSAMYRHAEEEAANVYVFVLRKPHKNTEGGAAR